ncbi:MAG: hypothetical protein ACRYGP_18155 [Janthinobacterium lividum]
MMSTRCVALATALTVFAAAPVSAKAISPVYKVVHSGTLTPIGFHYYLEEGCRSPGPVQINVVTPPQNGEVSEGPRSAHPSYPATSHLAACNRVKIRGTEIYYRSAPGYQGSDSYVVERIFPNGDAQRFQIDVSVR